MPENHLAYFVLELLDGLEDPVVTNGREGCELREELPIDGRSSDPKPNTPRPKNPKRARRRQGLWACEQRRIC